MAAAFWNFFSTIGNIFGFILCIASILGLIDLPAQIQRWKAIVVDRMGLSWKIAPWSLALLGLIIILISNVSFLSNIVMHSVDNPATRIQVDIQEFYIVDSGLSLNKTLLLLANVHNIAESPTVPENFQIRVADGDRSLGPFNTIPFHGTLFALYPDDFPGDQTFAITGAEFLEKRLTEKPVTIGVPVNGWLLFEILGIRDWRNAKMFLEFHDSFGKKEKVALDSPRQIPPLPKEIKFHRGVSYPFKDKNKLREPIK